MKDKELLEQMAAKTSNSKPQKRPNPTIINQQLSSGLDEIASQAAKTFQAEFNDLVVWHLIHNCIDFLSGGTPGGLCELLLKEAKEETENFLKERQTEICASSRYLLPSSTSSASNA